MNSINILIAMCRDACVTSQAAQFALRLAGGSVGTFLIISSATCFATVCFASSVSAFVRNFHTALFGILVILAEIRWEYLLRGVAFLKTFVGRGLLYIYLSTIVGTLIENTEDKIYMVVTLFLLWIGFMNLFLGCCFSHLSAQGNADSASPAVAQPASKGQPASFPASSNVDHSV